MSFHIHKIGLAIAFSPTSKAMFAEASRLATLVNAQLVLIHVGNHGAEETRKMEELVHQGTFPSSSLHITWKTGDPAKGILAACHEEGIDLLVAGALKKENLVNHYIGTIARTIMRKAKCSILMINSPSLDPTPVKNIVVNAEDSAYVEMAVEAACYIGNLEKASWIHVVRELKLLGLALTANEQCTEQEYDQSKQHMMQQEITQVEKILEHIPHDKTKINIKMLSGKSGFELARFAERKHAELLVVGAPPQRFSLIDRVFPHDLEYIFANLPCNLLIVNPVYSRKEAAHG